MKKCIKNKHEPTLIGIQSKWNRKDLEKNNISKAALNVIDTETFDLIKDTFANEELEENFSDLICRLKINNKDADTCFLVEHKYYKDRMAIF